MSFKGHRAYNLFVHVFIQQISTGYTIFTRGNMMRWEEIEPKQLG